MKESKRDAPRPRTRVWLVLALALAIDIERRGSADEILQARLIDLGGNPLLTMSCNLINHECDKGNDSEEN